MMRDPSASVILDYLRWRVESIVDGDQELIPFDRKLIDGDQKLIPFDRKLIDGDQKLISFDRKLIDGDQLLIKPGMPTP